MTDVALVTGAAGALGSEVARALSKRGCKLALVDTDRGRQRLEQLAESLGGACVVAGDISVAATWAEAVPRIERELGAPPSQAALVAGGWAGGKPLHAETSDDAWRSMMQGNVETVYRSLRALMPSMVARRRGSIVVIGSRAAVQPATSAGASAYAASKAAVVALAQSGGGSYRPGGVRDRCRSCRQRRWTSPANRAAMPSR